MIRRWYYVATAFYIVVCLQAFAIVDRNLYGEWDNKPGDKLTEGLNLLMVVASLALFCRGCRQLRSIRSGAASMLGLAAFLLSSMIWSLNPAGTASQGVVYLTVVLGAIGIATNLDADEYMKLVASICGLAAFSSLFMAIATPHLVYTSVGDFRGIFPHKNILGQAMMVGALASLHGLRATRQKRLRNGAILALVTTVCFMAKSATALTTIFVFFGVHALSAAVRKGGIARFLSCSMAIFVAGPILALVLISPDWLLETMGKDPTLTGRTDIWSFVIPDIFIRPLLGYGYNGFWNTLNPLAAEIDDAMHWTVPEAHNGLLEILLHVGMVGAIFFIFILMRNISLALRCLRTSEQALALSTLLCCTSVMLEGISETVLLNGLGASTPVFLVTGLLCERALWLRRRQWRAVASRRMATRYRMPLSSNLAR